jgi:hypothetical protein
MCLRELTMKAPSAIRVQLFGILTVVNEVHRPNDLQLVVVHPTRMLTLTGEWQS